MIDSITNAVPQGEFKAFSNQISEPAKLVHEDDIMEASNFKTHPNYCVTFAERQISCCIGIVDMVNSTKLAATLGMKKMSAYYQYFLNLMSKVIIEFDGQIIKNIGDCLLFYFPKTESHQNTSVFRECLDCSLAMIQTRDFLCSQMKKERLPCVSYRISLDYGGVVPMKSTDSNSQDMIGPAINMCSKINRCAKENGIVLGGDLYEIVKRFDGFVFKQVKGYSLGLKLAYPAYSLTQEY